MPLLKRTGCSMLMDHKLWKSTRWGEGFVMSVTRDTLTQIMGRRLEDISIWKWDKIIQRDEDGRVFLDINPKCFLS